MSPAEIIDAFYDGQSIAMLATATEYETPIVEALLRGYMIGLLAAAGANRSADDD